MRLSVERLEAEAKRGRALRTGPATVNAMSDAAPPDDQHDVTCPHCRKPFSAELIAGATARHRGFKCPHCRLFVPLTRATEQAPAELSG